MVRGESVVTICVAVNEDREETFDTVVATR